MIDEKQLDTAEPSQDNTAHEPEAPETVRESLVEAIEEVQEEASPQEIPEDEKEIASKYNFYGKLSPEDRLVLKEREKEIREGTDKYQPKLQAYDELEKVIAPRLEQIRQFGVTPAQTVDRLFQWMEQLSHPDENVKLRAFAQLCHNSGVDINHVINAPAIQQQPYQQQQRPQQQQVDPALVAKFEAKAKEFAADKRHPHFDRVKSKMGRLLVSGVIPGDDWETAYKWAVESDRGLNPGGAKKAQDTLDSARKQSNQNKLAGVKPSGNGAKHYPKESIRGSIQAALDTHRE